MRRTLVTMAALSGLLLLPADSSAIRVRASGGAKVGPLTPGQMMTVWSALLAYQPPDVAAQMAGNAIGVTARRAWGHTTVRISENAPGEIPPAFVVVVLGDFDASDDIETVRGDGSFTGQGTPIAAACGTVLMFEGTSSTSAPMTLRVNVNLGPRPQRVRRSRGDDDDDDDEDDEDDEDDD